MENQSRFSMKEWKPEQVYNKIQRLEEQINSLEEERRELVNQKRTIEVELTQFNSRLKQGIIPDREFAQINQQRAVIIAEKTKLDLAITGYKQKIQKLNSEKESAKIELKKKPNDAIKEGLLELRDKYLSFSADTTRVSSMRAMSSKFVEEIQQILSIIP